MATRTVPGAAPSQVKKGKPSLPLKSSKNAESAKVEASGPIDYSVGGKPNKEAYDREQNEIKAEIEKLQVKANEIRAKIASTSGKNADTERRAALRSELEAVRNEQASAKGGKQKVVDQIKSLQDLNGKRIKDLVAAKQKSPFKNSQELDNQIKVLEKRIESGTMKLVDEKRALSEISSLKRSRKTVEGFVAQQEQIDATKNEIEALRATLDDPAAKSSHDKIQALRAELDKISKKGEERQKEKDVLFESRNELQKQIDALWTKKKESTAAFRAANDKHFQKVQEERSRRMERQKEEKKKFEEEKKTQLFAQWREEAEQVAFAEEILDCNNLIYYFNKLRGINTPIPASNGLKTGGVGPSLNLRSVDEGVPDGAKALKKKGTEDEGSWGGLGGGKKGKKGKKAQAEEEEEKKETDKLNVPFQTLSALLKLGIEAPLVYGDLERTVKDLEKKKLYFESNQERVTKERIAAVEAKIAAQSNGKGKASEGDKSANGSAETEEKEEEKEDVDDKEDEKAKEE